MDSERGQSLLEVIIAMAVGILVVTALVFATIFSLRNAQFAKHSAQATKLAQEGIERVRSIRDRDNTITTSIGGINKFSHLFSVDLSHTICNTVVSDNPCYFTLISGILTQGVDTSFETVNLFKRQILIGDQTSSKDTQKTITVIVQWTDFAGTHESKLTTILRKL